MGSIIRTSRVLGLLAGVAIALTACSSTTAGIPQSSGPAAQPSAAAPTAAAPAPSLGGDDPFCTAAATMGMEAFGNLNAPNISEADGLKKIGEVWGKLAAIAPADIKADVAQIATAFTAATSGAGGDPAAIMASVGESMARYTAWGQAHCPNLLKSVKPPTG